MEPVKTLKITKIYLVCGAMGCGSVHGCIDEHGKQMHCETTQKGEVERSFPCSKEQYYLCTFEKDMIQENEAEGPKPRRWKIRCKYCPDPNFSPENCEDIAYLSS